ncbi:MAG: cytochrome b561 [Rickettsiales bacterium]|jgi:cytochrome b561
MQNQKYHISLRIIHWAMALIIISLLALGFYMEDFLDKSSPNRAFIYGLHKSFGALVLFLIALRIIFRIVKSAPPLPDSIGKKSRKLAHFVHISLYLLMIFMPLSGYLMSNAFGYPVHMFGIEMPMLIETNVKIGNFFAEVHEVLGFTFAAVLCLHISGAVKHRFFEKPENNVLKRMI